LKTAILFSFLFFILRKFATYKSLPIDKKYLKDFRLLLIFKKIKIFDLSQSPFWKYILYLNQKKEEVQR